MRVLKQIYRIYFWIQLRIQSVLWLLSDLLGCKTCYLQVNLDILIYVITSTTSVIYQKFPVHINKAVKLYIGQTALKGDNRVISLLVTHPQNSLFISIRLDLNLHYTHTHTHILFTSDYTNFCGTALLFEEIDLAAFVSLWSSAL